MTRLAKTETGVFDFACEAAGVFGLMAVFMFCLLAFAGVQGTVFWVVAAAAAIGCLIYLVYQLARKVLGTHPLDGRQLVLATLVPAIALVVTLVVAGERAGLFFLPFGHRDVTSQREIISVKKNADGTLTTHTRTAEPADTNAN